MKDQKQVWQAIENAVDEFAQEGDLRPDEVKQRYKLRSGEHEQIEWNFSIRPTGSFIACAYEHMTGGKIVPALSVELAIARVVQGSRSQAYHWCMKRNRTLDGLFRLAINEDLLMVCFQLVIDNQNIPLVRESLFRLPHVGEILLDEIGHSVRIEPFFSEGEPKVANLQ